MNGKPDLIVIFDVIKDKLAVLEAKKLNIPIVGIVDTNADPEMIDYVIPGNDDASRAIGLYCDLISRAALDGMSAQLGAAGVDLGEMEEAPSEEVLAEAVEEELIPEDATESTTSTTKADSKEIADKVEVTTKKSKASAKKPKSVAKKATSTTKAKKKDDDKVSKSSSVDDKKAESDEKPAEDTV